MSSPLAQRLNSKGRRKSPIGGGALSLLLLTSATLNLLTGPTHVFCQDFEDLNTNNYNSENTAAATSSRRLSSLAASVNNANEQANQQQQSQQQPQAFQSLAMRQQHNTRHSITRPVLSSRFSSSSSSSSSPGAGTPVASPTLSAQASFAASVYSAPPANFNVQQTSASGSTSNIEQLMRNALARTTGQQAVAESRHDPIIASAATNSESLAPQQTLPQRPQVAMAPSQANQQASVATAAAVATVADGRQPETSESSTEMTAAGLQDDGAKATTLTDTTSGHETVYSDQRFANLFARRNNLKKSKINPTEQIKAKPTLPSFIKSPPDPKQFTASASNIQERPATPSSNSFASQRLQQNQSGRLIGNLNNQNNQLNKPKVAITSNSAAAANNKRTNVLNNGNKPLTSSPSSRPSALGNQKSTTSTTSKPALPAANNPFGRQQNNNSDPANVIAMARKRLLANNALESAKLKQQQNAKPT